MKKKKRKEKSFSFSKEKGKKQRKIKRMKKRQEEKNGIIQIWAYEIEERNENKRKEMKRTEKNWREMKTMYFTSKGGRNIYKKKRKEFYADISILMVGWGL